VFAVHRHEGGPGAADGAGEEVSASGRGDALHRLPLGEAGPLLPNMRDVRMRRRTGNRLLRRLRRIPLRHAESLPSRAPAPRRTLGGPGADPRRRVRAVDDGKTDALRLSSVRNPQLRLRPEVPEVRRGAELRLHRQAQRGRGRSPEAGAIEFASDIAHCSK